MLARLLRIPGIGSIDVDHSGTLMRLRIADADPDAVADAALAVLRMEGYSGAALSRSEEAQATYHIEAWHGTAADLSREEAHVLASEAADAFARERGIAPAATERLRRTIGEHLYRSFAADDAAAHAGALVERAFPPMAAEARSYLDPGDADALGPFLVRWRSERS